MLNSLHERKDLILILPFEKSSVCWMQTNVELHAQWLPLRPHNTPPPPKKFPWSRGGIRNAHKWQAESSAASNVPSAWVLSLCFSRYYLLHRHSLCSLWEKMKMRASNDFKLCHLCPPEGWDSQKSLSWESQKISEKGISCLILDRNIIL